MRKCTACHQEKLDSEFYKYRHNKAGLRPECKDCYKLRCRIKYSKNNKAHLKRNKKWQLDNIDRIKIIRTRCRVKSYGLSMTSFENMLNKSDGKCYICGLNNGEIKLCIDHNHQTGEVRGLLCNSCNTGLGKLKEDVNILEKAIAYLKTNAPQSTTSNIL